MPHQDESALAEISKDQSALPEGVSQNVMNSSAVAALEDESLPANGLSATLSIENGLIVRLLPSGDVMQAQSASVRAGMEGKNLGDDEEESRIVTGKGTVARYMRDGRIELLFANGNCSEYDPETQLWTITNNKGMRRRKRNRDCVEFDV